MAAFDELDFYTDAAAIDDPYPFFAHWRAKGPVVELPHHGVVAITTYDETVEVLRDHERFSSCNAVTGPFPGFGARPEGDDVNDFIAAHRDELPMSEYMVTQDPPLHEDQRGLIMRLFTPKRMRENEAFMWDLAAQMVEPAVRDGRVEVLRDYGRVFTTLVIAYLLGIPEADRNAFRERLDGVGAARADPVRGGPGSEAVPLVHDPLEFLQARFRDYVEDRRAHPRGDVLSEMATATYRDGRVPEAEAVVRMGTFLFAAGQDTSSRLIAMSLRIIAENPDIQHFLRDDPSRIGAFIEEVLRFESVVKSQARTARVTTTVGGVKVEAGTQLGIFPGAANRDPARFECPDEFRPDRENASAHLSFGRGVHACPGGPLARLETVVSVATFLSKTSHIAIDEERHGPADDRDFRFEPTYVLRGLRRLHLLLTPAAPDAVPPPAARSNPRDFQS
ncbi:MAG TPA: cytochrome P450 [Acidimicrobiales bacterium]|jgi:cytochrome P450|nr:cytochrome P450 [Acidimicrobiales bacterium]